ncbi:MAG: DUF2878 domain-containing protein [Xanthomonadaceae bacterium]|nr:DUF2878 domain-containing protein [Xanthomonadaceae bacterium]
MNFWLVFIAYEAAWCAAVIGAGAGHAWPGVVAIAFFAAWRLLASRQRAVETRLVFVALLLGLVFDAVLAAAGFVDYAAAWPWPLAPAWLTALWVAFALTIVPLFGYLHGRPWMAALFGAIGGPLAYLGAARGWQAVTLVAPSWHALAALAVGWAVAMPVLCTLARRGLQARSVAPAFVQGSVP